MSVGEQAPDFEAESTTGKIRLSSLRGGGGWFFTSIQNHSPAAAPMN